MQEGIGVLLELVDGVLFGYRIFLSLRRIRPV